jgi:UDP-2,3-diacylglucosamine hydrolase
MDSQAGGPTAASDDAAAMSSTPVLPALHAPPSWRCIDFISDLHLHESHPRTFDAFQRYLRGTSADAVFILGDLFEAWVGDDMRHQPFEAACTHELLSAGQRLSLHLMAGNRDFLLGADMARACHATLLSDPTVLHAFGQRHVLTHGDAWCLDDTDYQAFRAQSRSEAWQSRFLSQPLEARLATARAMREASESRKHGMQQEDWADVTPEAAAPVLTAAGASQLIHGHTHRPGTQPFALPQAQRHVLSDWDLDQAPERAEVFRLHAQGHERLSVDAAISTQRSGA